MAAESAFVIVPATVASWEQHPEYVEACRENYMPGDLDAYTPAHPRSTESDFTSFKYGLSRYNEDNLPNIMYQLWPCRAWRDFQKSSNPPPMKDSRGKIVKERYPRPGERVRTLLDFPILRGIDQIATDAPAWLLEMWMRLDPRLKWDDIDMRMKNVGIRRRLGFQGFKNTRLNNKTARLRQSKFMISWRDRIHGTSSKARDSALAHMSQAQLNANSTHPSLAQPQTSSTGLQATVSAASMVLRSTPQREGRQVRLAGQSARASSHNAEARSSDTELTSGSFSKRTRPTRAYAIYVAADEDNDNDTTASEYEPVPPLSRHRRLRKASSADDPQDDEEKMPKDGTTERSLATECEMRRTKKQRLFEDKGEDKAMTDPYLHPHLHIRDASTALNSNRRPKYVARVLEHRRLRLAPHATSCHSLTSLSAFAPPIFPYTFNSATSSFTANDWLQTISHEDTGYIYQPTNMDVSTTQQDVEMDKVFEGGQGSSPHKSIFLDPASWSSEWKAFIIDHDAEPILKAHVVDKPPLTTTSRG